MEKNAKTQFEKAKTQFEDAKTQFEDANTQFENSKTRFSGYPLAWTGLDRRPKKTLICRLAFELQQDKLSGGRDNLDSLGIILKTKIRQQQRFNLIQNMLKISRIWL